MLAAGNATRMGGAYKPNVVVNGKRMIDWQRQAIKTVRTVIVAPPTNHFPEAFCRMVWDDSLRGPVGALAKAIPATRGKLTVAYADTWWAYTPGGHDWVGVCRAQGGRVWDWVGWSALRGEYTFNRGEIGKQSTTRACVGLYAFSDPEALQRACDEALAEHPQGEVHMVEVLKRYEPGVQVVDIPEWLDVGDSDAWRKADTMLRGGDAA